MKRAALAALVFLTLTAEKCNTDKGSGAGELGNMASLLDSRWVLQTLNGNALAMPEGMPAPWLKLGKEGNTVEGNGGCNALMGTYKLDGDKVSFPGTGSTKKYCEATMPTENAFLGALKRVDQFKLDGGVLKLLGAGSELATFKAE